MLEFKIKLKYDDRKYDGINPNALATSEGTIPSFN